jgi:hypothetical protein
LLCTLCFDYLTGIIDTSDVIPHFTGDGAPNVVQQWWRAPGPSMRREGMNIDAAVPSEVRRRMLPLWIAGSSHAVSLWLLAKEGMRLLPLVQSTCADRQWHPLADGRTLHAVGRESSESNRAFPAGL